MPRLSKIGAACLAAFGWTSGVSAVTASYLVVAGGGGGGSRFGGGGGAGGLLSGTSSLNPTVTYTVTVGAGGTGGPATGGSGTAGASDGSNGADSVFNAVTSIGGGGGGAGDSRNGLSGGSGGGGAGRFATSGGSATSGQGNAGGGSTGSGPNYYGGGGGGAGAAGNGGSNSVAPGGIGLTSSITGTSTYYAGGGGGAGDGTISAPGSNGGLGGGGAGGITAGTAGTSNTGGGGGGGGNGPGSGNSPGGNGGSGVVIISYPAPQLFWGGFVTTSGGNVIHTFTTSGSLAPITTSVTANYLQVAGGGGGAGGTAGGGGGGAGGYLAGTTSLSLASSYTVTVGAGGTGGAIDAVGSQGSNSQFGALTASVGGGYGGYGSGAPSIGGSGGGAGGRSTGSATNGAAGTSGQGSAGGSGLNDSGNQSGGGGGGASAVGSNASGSSTGGAGGAGTASSITGSSVTYAGGGGGAGYYNTALGTLSNGAYGGAGGGGNANAPGTANLGGGGGGGGGSAGGGGAGAGAKGGSGVVIISYPGSQLFGGGVVTYNGTNTVHTFNTSGTLIPIVSLSASYLIVAGGAGASGGGGGAGGFLSGAGVTIDTNSTYLITVGAGGIGQDPSSAGTNGGNSAISIVPTTAIGGGGGGHFSNSAANNGNSGGSGGGGGGSDNSGPPGYGASGTGGQGNRGGDAVALNTSQARGGGGGAGAAGANGSSSTGGAGGVGLTSSLSGTSTYYAGGGGGGSGNSTNAAGGNGGGGAGGQAGSNGTAGTANTGGGGGGSGSVSAATGGNGGSGVVIISYAGSTQLMAGGTVTISGGNVIHTFTSSGYLTPLTFVGNSLRFRASNSAYLSRTNTVTGNRKTWTWSGWVKRGASSDGTSSFHYFLMSGDDGGGGTFIDLYANTMRVYFGGGTYLVQTSQVFRDYSAWYHFVVAVDTTQATDTNRVKIYVNGVQVTSFSSATYPTQNLDTAIDGAYPQYIAKNISTNYFDGYMTEVRLIDGQALTPNSFGTFNSYGVWQPITYGGSYGTNGFYLPFNAGTATYSGYFSGSSSNLQVANSAVFNAPGTQDFTVEGWYYLNSIPGSGIYGFWGCDNGSGSVPKQTAYIDTSGLVHFDATLSGGASIATTATALSTGRWYHLAWVRSGSSFTIYVDGVAKATGTSSVNLTGLTQPLYVGYVGEPSGTLAGYASNFRYVLGTAIYTANFTPPTSALTNVSGTVLLTLQGSTIVDNSSNAFSITNNGSITMAQNYPFSAGKIFNDQSSAGNNWTPNNISGANGSTLDYMTDVPTLTSATQANYCVMNPLKLYSAANFTFADGNLKLTYTSNLTAQAIASMSFGTSGTYYFEVTVIEVAGSNGFIGLMPTSAAFATNTPPIVGYYRSSGNISNFTTGVTAGNSYTTGDIIGIAVDVTNGTVQFYKNNVAQGTTPSYSFTAGTDVIAYLATDNNAGNKYFAVNFGQQPYVYTPPSGFVALNTYNL